MRITLAIVVMVGSLAAGASAQKAVRGRDDLPDGWKVHLDDPAAAVDQVLVQSKENAVTFTTGPAGFYYKPDLKGAADYELSAAVSQIKTTARPEAYGLCVAGSDLDTDRPRYTCFLVRQDGQFAIERRDGPDTAAIAHWAPAPAMREPSGMKTSNTLVIRVTGDEARFSIDGKDVQTLTRAQIGGDGIAGVRVGADLNVQVTKLRLRKTPGARGKSGDRGRRGSR